MFAFYNIQWKKIHMNFLKKKKTEIGLSNGKYSQLQFSAGYMRVNKLKKNTIGFFFLKNLIACKCEYSRVPH